MYTRIVTAQSEPMLMKKKNQLKKFVIRVFSSLSESSNWSEPKPDTLDFRPPVPRAVRYSAKSRTASCLPLAGMQGGTVSAAHLGGRRLGITVEIVKIMTP